MTNLSPKDKAKALVDKYYEYSQDVGQAKYSSKQCALICCNEIIEAVKKNNRLYFAEKHFPFDDSTEIQYWQ